MLIRAILLAAFLTLAGCAHPMEHAHACAVRLTMGDGVCSGTIIGPHAVLSATHCFDGAPVEVSGKPVKVLRRIDDGDDHTILVTDQAFHNWVSIGSAPTQTEHVYYFGNPAALVDQYRSGHVSGVATEKGLRYTMYDINGWLGDSGSGVFNDRGELIAVISILYSTSQEQPMHLMGSLPLKFTPKQWAEARQ